LKLQYDEQLSNFAFKISLRHYNPVVLGIRRAGAEYDRMREVEAKVAAW